MSNFDKLAKDIKSKTENTMGLGEALKHMKKTMQAQVGIQSGNTLELYNAQMNDIMVNFANKEQTIVTLTNENAALKTENSSLKIEVEELKRSLRKPEEATTQSN